MLFLWSEGLILVISSSLVLHIIATGMCGFHDYSSSFSITISCFLKVGNQWGHWFSSRPKGQFISLKSPSLNTSLLFGCWGSRTFLYSFFFKFVVVNWYFPLRNCKHTSIDHILLTLYNCRASLNSSLHYKMIKGTRFLNKWQQVYETDVSEKLVLVLCVCVLIFYVAFCVWNWIIFLSRYSYFVQTKSIYWEYCIIVFKTLKGVYWFHCFFKENVSFHDWQINEKIMLSYGWIRFFSFCYIEVLKHSVVCLCVCQCMYHSKN